MANRGYVEERSVLGIADHCDGCLAEAGKGWRPIGTLLPIGGRDCKARCRCHFEYRMAGERGEFPDRIPISESTEISDAKLKYLLAPQKRGDKTGLLRALGLESPEDLRAAIRVATSGRVANIDSQKPDGAMGYTVDAELVGPKESRRMTFVWVERLDGVVSFVTLRPVKKRKP